MHESNDLGKFWAKKSFRGYQRMLEASSAAIEYSHFLFWLIGIIGFGLLSIHVVHAAQIVVY